MSPCLRGFITRNNLGLLLLIIAVAISLFQVLRSQKQLDPPGKTTLRIAFWQLEAGYRDAMQQMIDEYQKLHPNVRIVMMPITEKFYTQWLNVHLIAGDAPDLCEMGMATLTNSDAYRVRYFTPLSEFVNQPNPYNAGTPLAKTPWRDTFIDGLRGEPAFAENVQEYFAIPTSFFGTGLYYNRDLLDAARALRLQQAAAGTYQGPLPVVPPRTYGQLLTMDQALKDLARAQNRRLVPLVSCYRVTEPAYLLEQYNVAFTALDEDKIDTNLDGYLSQAETYAAYLAGPNRFDTPRQKAFYAALRRLMADFAPGFIAMDRQEATFKFVQGEAAMIITGSWDAKSLAKSIAAKTKGRFTLGAMRYPVPARGDILDIDGKPVDLGNFVLGPMNTANAAGGAGYGITKLSRHPEIAIDFLHFLTSARQNERFNGICDWCPVIAGAKPTELTAPFMPDPEGFDAKLDWDFNDRIRGEYMGKLAQYLTGEISYDAFAQAMDRQLADPDTGGTKAWAKAYEDDRNAVRTDERTLAIHAAMALMGPDPQQATARYRRALLQQLQKNDGESNPYRFRKLTGQQLPWN